MLHAVFMVGFSSGTKTIDPGKLTKEQYQTAYTYTRTVNERMSDVITYVSKMDEQELSWFKESFHIAEFQELLKETTKK